MYSRFQLLNKYLRYWFTASNSKGHGIHSPFVFEFIAKVLNDKSAYPVYDKVENLREELLKDNSVLNVEDLGAGSSKTISRQRTVSSIAKNAVKPKKYSQLLFRMVKFYQPHIILELGTSLGFTTAYLSLANPDAKLISMEGAMEVAAIAKKNFRTLELQNPDLVEGNFNDTLLAAVRSLSSIDFAFIDGNHRQEPTENYFQELLLKTNDNSILVFDDIHWSAEMEAAWSNIKEHPAVTCTIDLFFFGILFFRTEFKEKQHFKIWF